MGKINIRKNIYPLLLLLLSIIPLLDLLNPGLPVTHDGQDHVARIANFYRNLLEGTIIPRWAANLNWGYGHPVMMFLYPFPSYLSSFFHAVGFSLVDSLKLVFAVSFVLSGLTMYFWLKAFLPKPAAFSGSVLYLFAPYRFVDLYVRGAIGEHVAFIFPPLVLYFMLKLSKKYSYKYVFFGALSLAALILSHNAISLMFLPLFLIYFLYLIHAAKNKKSLILNTFYFIFLGFALSAFFWFPAFFEGKYTLRDIVTKGGYQNNFGSIGRMIYSPWNYGLSGDFTIQVGIFHWISVIASIPAAVYLRKNKNSLWLINVGLVFLFFGYLLLIDQNSRFIWDHVSIIQKFQFPWRFLSAVLFSGSVIGAITVASFKKQSVLITFFLTIALLLSTKDYWSAKGYDQKPESFYTSVYNSTTDTGESAPVWSVRFMEQRPKAPVEIIEGKAVIQNFQKTSTSRRYVVKADTESRIRENTLYFPGWKVYVNNIETPIEFQDVNNRGLITFYVPKGIQNIKVLFEETKLRLFANSLSLVSLLSILAWGIKGKHKLLFNQLAKRIK